MKKILATIPALTLLISCRTSIDTIQTSDKNKVGVKSSKFRGTLFTNSYPSDSLFIENTESVIRFSPTAMDIALAESIVKKQLRETNKIRLNQIGKRQYIHRNLDKYFRQYVGFVNNKGDRIIHINFHWDRYTLMDKMNGYWDTRLDYTSGYSIVFDGGSKYWNVNVNLTSKTLYGLYVNGFG